MYPVQKHGRTALKRGRIFLSQICADFRIPVCGNPRLNLYPMEDTAIYFRATKLGFLGVAVILYTDDTDLTELHGKAFKKSVYKRS